MIEIVLGNGTTIVGCGMKDGRRYVSLQPNQKKRKIGAKLPKWKSDFPDDVIVIWLDKPESANVLSRAIGTALSNPRPQVWKYVITLKDGAPSEDVRGAS